MPDNIPSTPLQHDGGVSGGPEQPISKPMDKPAKQYTSNETVPADNFHEEAPPGELENPGDLSKRFVR